MNDNNKICLFKYNKYLSNVILLSITVNLNTSIQNLTSKISKASAETLLFLNRGTFRRGWKPEWRRMTERWGRPHLDDDILGAKATHPVLQLTRRRGRS